MSTKAHWEQIYSSKQVKSLGWYVPHIQPSLDWVKALKLDLTTPIIDIGGGASTLVDDLVDVGYRAITVLDISKSALSSAKAKMRDKAGLAAWMEADITLIDLPADRYKVWHDRAVFHFLSEADQHRYLNNLRRALQPGGEVIIGTFALDGPDTCSGLPVQRYSSDQLSDILGSDFQLIQDHKELHITPWGMEQMFLYCHFRSTIV